jgi:hypothetical protein
MSLQKLKTENFELYNLIFNWNEIDKENLSVYSKIMTYNIIYR